MDGTVDYDDVVRQVVLAACQRAGSSPALAKALTEAGVVQPSGRPYSRNAISHWREGRNACSANVILFCARFAGVSLDDLLGLADEDRVGLAAVAKSQRDLAAAQRRTAAILQRIEDRFSAASPEEQSLKAPRLRVESHGG